MIGISTAGCTNHAYAHAREQSSANTVEEIPEGVCGAPCIDTKIPWQALRVFDVWCVLPRTQVSIGFDGEQWPWGNMDFT